MIKKSFVLAALKAEIADTKGYLDLVDKTDKVLISNYKNFIEGLKLAVKMIREIPAEKK